MSYSFGALQSPPDYRDYLYRAIFAAESLPRKFSRRSEMGPVRNQGQFGTCVGFGSAGVKDNQESREWGGKVQTSPLYIYAKCKQQDGIPDTEGTYPRVAMKVLHQSGVCKEGTFPYSRMSWPKMPAIPAEADNEAAQYKIGAYARITMLDEVKQAIVKDGPVLGGIMVCENFMNPSPDGFISMPKGRIMGGHAICVVGYNDDMTANGRTGYLEVRNSWGETWGDGGYCYIPYDFFNGKTADLGVTYWFESWSSVDVVLPPQSCKEGYLWIGRNTALIDGVEVALDVPPEIKGDRTLVPLRFMSEHMGYRVDWDPVKSQVHFWR